MDIKIEPENELLLSNGATEIDNDVKINVNILSEGHSTGDGFGVHVKKEEFDDGNYSKEEVLWQVAAMDLQEIRHENEEDWQKYNEKFNDEQSSIKIEQNDIGECSYAEYVPDKTPTADILASNVLTFNTVKIKIKNELNRFIEKLSSKKKKKNVEMEKRFKCDKCNYKTEFSTNFKRHTCKVEKKPYTCDQCNYKTESLSNFKRHKRIHSDDKPYICDECSLSFKFYDQLKTHQYKHSGVKPHKCDICEYRTVRASSLKKHKRTHSIEKSLKCDQCDFECARPNTQNLNLQCQRCEFKTFTVSLIRKHRRLHKSERIFK